VQFGPWLRAPSGFRRNNFSRREADSVSDDISSKSGQGPVDGRHSVQKEVYRTVEVDRPVSKTSGSDSDRRGTQVDNLEEIRSDGAKGEQVQKDLEETSDCGVLPMQNERVENVIEEFAEMSTPLRNTFFSGSPALGQVAPNVEKGGPVQSKPINWVNVSTAQEAHEPPSEDEVLDKDTTVDVIFQGPSGGSRKLNVGSHPWKRKAYVAGEGVSYLSPSGKRKVSDVVEGESIISSPALHVGSSVFKKGRKEMLLSDQLAMAAAVKQPCQPQ
jgi:hypothetical protein